MCKLTLHIKAMKGKKFKYHLPPQSGFIDQQGVEEEGKRKEGIHHHPYHMADCDFQVILRAFSVTTNEHTD